MVNKKCEVCGSGFEVRKYRENTARFCSKKCGGSWHAKTRLAHIPKPWVTGKKPKGFKPSNGFKKGQKAWNKGKKGIHLSRKSEFKKGQKPINYLTVGTERTRLDKHNNPRVWVKIAEPSKWRPRAQIVWEKHNGPLIRGFVVHHKNRITNDDRIENLELLSISAHMKEHREEMREG